MKNLPLDSETIQKRLKDYSREDPLIVKKKLIAEWKRAYPIAVKEKCQWLKPLLKLSGKESKTRPDEPDSVWGNDVYNVTFRWFQVDPLFKSDQGMIVLGISRLDGTAKRDWRDFQAIKNQLAGEECEGIELYPAESRLVDPSNYFMIWCFPGIKRIPIGMNFRRVLDQDEAISAQRKFAEKESNG